MTERAGAEGTTPAARRVGVASLPPPIPQNPYQRLLYEHLAAERLPLIPLGKLDVGSLWRCRRTVSVLHFHWPQAFYRHDGANRSATRLLSWVKAVLFAGRLKAARLLRYRIVWTVHQLFPHESSDPALDRIAAAMLARASDALIVHDDATANQVRQTWPALGRKLTVIPHGPFVRVYPGGRPRQDVRVELGIDDTSVVLLAFGHIRAYKGLTDLLDAFTAVPEDDAVLVVAGLPIDDGVAQHLEAAAEDPRIRLRLEFIPDERVAELFHACDLAVLARTDGGTSGALVLALSMGLPAVVADAPAYRELTGNGKSAWYFDPGDKASLAQILGVAVRDRQAREAKTREAKAFATERAWPEIAARTAAVLRGDDGPKAVL